MRTIGLVTVARSDWGIYRPVARALAASPELEPLVFVGGAHLDPRFGLTVDEVEAEGWPIAARVPSGLMGDSPEEVAQALGRLVTGFAQALAARRPDILMVLGDRWDMLAAACAALPLNLPLAHLYGGELTLGAIDDACRHAITKLSHLHFAATEEYARRIAQLGEEPWRVTVCGAAGLDNLREMALADRPALEKRLGLALAPAPLVVTFHPQTLGDQDAAWQVGEMLAALEEIDRPLVLTRPGADARHRAVSQALEAFAAHRGNARLVDSLGTQAYFGLLKIASAMVGNSSSGIIEAPSFALPVVNIGARQEGRVRAANVIDVGHGRQEIAAGLERALDPAFCQGLKGMVNPYDRGGAARLIAQRLARVDLGERLLRKGFNDLPAPSVDTK